MHVRTVHIRNFYTAHSVIFGTKPSDFGWVQLDCARLKVIRFTSEDPPSSLAPKAVLHTLMINLYAYRSIYTRTATGHKKCPDDDSDLGHMHTATGHRRCSSSQTVVQRAGGLAAEQLLHIPFFHTHHQLTERIFTLFAYSFFVITHLWNS